MKFAPVEKINLKPSDLPAGELVNVTSAFLSKAKLPAMPQTKMRCYYWLGDMTPQSAPQSLADAILSAKSIDVAFESRAPEHLRKALPKTAFAFQFVSYGAPSALNRAFQLVGVNARYKEMLDDDIYLVGQIDKSITGQPVMKPILGSYILIEPGMQVLRIEDLRAEGAKTLAEVKVPKAEISQSPAHTIRTIDDIPAFLRRSV